MAGQERPGDRVGTVQFVGPHRARKVVVMHLTLNIEGI